MQWLGLSPRNLDGSVTSSNASRLTRAVTRENIKTRTESLVLLLRESSNYRCDAARLLRARRSHWATLVCDRFPRRWYWRLQLIDNQWATGYAAEEPKSLPVRILKRFLEDLLILKRIDPLNLANMPLMETSLEVPNSFNFSRNYGCSWSCKTLH